MGTVNIGGQNILWRYKTPLNGSVLTQIMSDIVPEGVYDGLVASKAGPTLVGFTKGTLYVRDSDNTDRVVRIDFTEDFQVSIVPATQYLVCRFTWADAVANYADIVLTPTPLPTDVVLASVLQTGGIIDSLDNSCKKQVPRDLVAFLMQNAKVSSTFPYTMALNVEAARLLENDGSLIDLPADTVVIPPPAVGGSEYIVAYFQNTAATGYYLGVHTVVAGEPLPNKAIPLASVALAEGDTYVTPLQIRVLRWVPLCRPEAVMSALTVTDSLSIEGGMQKSTPDLVQNLNAEFFQGKEPGDFADSLEVADLTSTFLNITGKPSVDMDPDYFLPAQVVVTDNTSLPQLVRDTRVIGEALSEKTLNIELGAAKAGIKCEVINRSNFSLNVQIAPGEIIIVSKNSRISFYWFGSFWKGDLLMGSGIREYLGEQSTSWVAPNGVNEISLFAVGAGGDAGNPIGSQPTPASSHTFSQYNNANPAQVLKCSDGTLISYGFHGSLRSKRSSDGGATWSAEIMPYSGGSGYGCIVEAPNGDLVAFYRNGGQATYERKISTDKGLTWGSVLTVVAATAFAHVVPPRAFVTASGALLFLYYTASNTVNILRSVNNGDTYSSISGLSLPTLASSLVSEVLLLPGGRLIFFTAASTSPRLVYSDDNGVTWLSKDLTTVADGGFSSISKQHLCKIARIYLLIGRDNTGKFYKYISEDGWVWSTVSPSGLDLGAYGGGCVVETAPGVYTRFGAASTEVVKGGITEPNESGGSGAYFLGTVPVVPGTSYPIVLSRSGDTACFGKTLGRGVKSVGGVGSGTGVKNGLSGYRVYDDPLSLYAGAGILTRPEGSNGGYSLFGKDGIGAGGEPNKNGYPGGGGGSFALGGDPYIKITW